MPTRPEPFAALAAKQAKSPEVAGFFEQLASRAQRLAQLQDEGIECAQRYREAKTGKPFQYTKRQERMLDAFDRDAEKAIRDWERLIVQKDDKRLLISILSSEHQGLEMDEGMALASPPELKETAQRLVDFRRETIRLIEQFVETSQFKGQVVPRRRVKKEKRNSAG
jgi:hypothetical protein